jgi:hypothetical protein
MLKTSFIAIGLWLFSLAVGTASIGLGDFGAPLWLIVLLLIWLGTLGAPTTAAVLVVAWYWPGGSFLVFLGLASVVALVAQFLGVWTASRLMYRLRVKQSP